MIPGIAEVFLHIVENLWLGILHLHNCGTIDDNLKPIFTIFFGLLDCDIILLSQSSQVEISVVVIVPRYRRRDANLPRSYYPNYRYPATRGSIISSSCKVHYSSPTSIRPFNNDPERNAVNLVPSRICLL